ncbi:ubiquinone biosynthesis protein UbiB [Cereibacter sphaeroides]|uniref:ABC1 kinase family protein n=1 Tax=Cereibacter sphaeroides TaxID=1063 RepID=UPI001F264A24|nr:AarF/UbiB family protein [Cereibacter sphaeroides]MCE6951382.1 ubiquinone biosynthesis protein UbiB [Cereibacter sphaeroides]
MIPGDPVRALHDLGRVAELARILIRHGSGDVLRRLGLERVARVAGLGTGMDASGARLPPQARLRLALEEMGPTFVKLGQILSTRVDLLPPDWIEELSKLQNAVPPVPFADLVAEIEAELGHPLLDDFERIDTEPLGAGSIAQVHRAWLAGGRAVILKIRRPGIREVIESDLRLLMRLADMASAESAMAARFHPRAIAEEIARSIRSELDLANEGRNAERIAASFGDRPDIHIPAIHWQWTNERMNVQDIVTGLPGTDLDAVRAAGLDLQLIAARGASAVLQMMFDDRFFHADPHPGNVFYLPGNEIAFIDFGMVGHLSRQRRDELVDLLFGIVEERPDRVARILLGWSGAGPGPDPALETRIDRFIDRVHRVPLKAIRPAALAGELVALIREHDLVLPSDLAMLIKAFTTLEGMGRTLDPEFDMVAAAEPFLRRVILERHRPSRLVRQLRDAAASGAGLAIRFPEDLGELLAAAQRGDLRARLDMRQIEDLPSHIDRAATRVALAILIAALILGSSIVMTAIETGLPMGLGAFATLGFLAAVAGGLWLLWSILRGGPGHR